MKAIYVFTLLGSFVVSALGQDIPNVKYAGSGQKRRVVEITNMLGDVPYMTCGKKPDLVIGKIVKRDFDEDEITVTSFVVADARDKRIPINLNEDQVGILGHHRNSIISELLGKGNRVQVTRFTCSGGGSGIFFYAERIKLL